MDVWAIRSLCCNDYLTTGDTLAPAKHTMALPTDKKQVSLLLIWEDNSPGMWEMYEQILVWYPVLAQNLATEQECNLYGFVAKIW